MISHVSSLEGMYSSSQGRNSKKHVLGTEQSACAGQATRVDEIVCGKGNYPFGLKRNQMSTLRSNMPSNVRLKLQYIDV